MTNFSGVIKVEEISSSKKFEGSRLRYCLLPRKSNGARKETLTEVSEYNRTLFVPAEDGGLLDKVVSIIDNAREEIYVSSYLIQESKMTKALLEAADRGVFIVVLTSKDSELAMSDDELEASRGNKADQIEGHKRILDVFAGKIMVRTFSGFHAKYILADPFSDSPAGIIMTCNATVGAMTGDNIEVAATLTPKEAKAIFGQHIHGFWNMANYELLEKGKLDPVVKNNVHISFADLTMPSTAGSYSGLKSEIIRMIYNAEKRIVVTSWKFEAGHEVMTELAKAIDRGVALEVYAKLDAGKARNMAPLIPLIDKGAKVYAQSRFHAKMLLVDDREGLLMTANIEKKGMDEGFEAGIRLDNEDTKAALKILARLKDQCEAEVSKEVMLKGSPGLLYQYNEPASAFSEVIVEDMLEKKLPEKQFSSCVEMLEHEIKDSDFPSNVNGNRHYRNIKLIQLLKPPLLPKDAEDLKDEEATFPVYATGKDKKKLYIPVKTWEEVKAVRKYAEQVKAKVVMAS